jgi:hypothetical protein
MRALLLARRVITSGHIALMHYPGSVRRWKLCLRKLLGRVWPTQYARDLQYYARQPCYTTELHLALGADARRHSLVSKQVA